MGVVTVGIVRGLKVGYQCAIMIVIAHGVCSPIIFALAYLVYNSSHTRVISSNKGSLRTPVLSFFLFLLLAINMGVPPSLNLWREVFIFVAFLRTPVLSFFLFLLLAINMGVPPSLNLWREVFIFVAFLRIITYSTLFLIIIAFLGVVYNLFIYVSLRQSKEFDFLKVEYIY